MTMNMQAMLDQAFDAGREAERKMASIAARGGGESLVISLPPKPATAVAVKPTRTIRASDLRDVTSGTKKSAGPRTKGVKEAILALLAGGLTISTASLIATTGFKSTSVRATLMGLKKAGIAMSDGAGHWWLVNQGILHGNSEEAMHAAD